MIKTKKSNVNYKLYSNEELIKEFKNKKVMNIFIKEFNINDYIIVTEKIN